MTFFLVAPAAFALLITWLCPFFGTPEQDEAFDRIDRDLTDRYGC